MQICRIYNQPYTNLGLDVRIMREDANLEEQLTKQAQSLLQHPSS